MSSVFLMIEIKDLHLCFGEKIILSNFNLHINRGEFVTILGPSGCGKSTLFNCLAGFSVPNRGTITIEGKSGKSSEAKVGLIFQEYAIFPWRTVIKNLMLGFYGQPISNADKKLQAEKLIKLVGLSGFENYYPKALSGGMKQRVAIARALAMDSPVILMDEPFGALDNFMRERLQDLVLKVWRELNKTILFVTHNLREAVFLGNRILLMNQKGNIIRDQKTPTVSNRTEDSFFQLEKEIRPLLSYEVN